jgi:hypothetical protein
MRVSVCRLSAGNTCPEQTASVPKWLRRYCLEPGVIASIFIASIVERDAASDNAVASFAMIVAAGMTRALDSP